MPKLWQLKLTRNDPKNQEAIATAEGIPALVTLLDKANQDQTKRTTHNRMCEGSEMIV